MNELSTLFFLSFLSSTLLPGGSEAYLSFLVIHSNLVYFNLLMLATIGNTLGGFSNWLIGYMINTTLIAKIRLKEKNTERNKKYQLAEKWINKWGYLSLLLSWLPLIGDLLCLVAGIYKLNWFRSIIAIFIGKLIRYTILITLVQELAMKN